MNGLICIRMRRWFAWSSWLIDAMENRSLRLGSFAYASLAAGSLTQLLVISFRWLLATATRVKSPVFCFFPFLIPPPSPAVYSAFLLFLFSSYFSCFFRPVVSGRFVSAPFGSGRHRNYCCCCWCCCCYYYYYYYCCYLFLFCLECRYFNVFRFIFS